ncbi:MAG: hypothetical protein A2061_08040 [Gallionellales bacterium GWA2_59_43]|nr:MAG: hypothetical protein A2061_08040 [Gallionellales bacterium GWA2_59_43]
MPRQFDFTMYRGFMRTCTPLLNCASVREIEVELSEVDYLDIFALDMLILLKERATAANKSISLLNISSRALRTLEHTHLGANIRYTATAQAN